MPDLPVTNEPEKIDLDALLASDPELKEMLDDMRIAGGVGAGYNESKDVPVEPNSSYAGLNENDKALVDKAVDKERKDEMVVTHDEIGTQRSEDGDNKIVSSAKAANLLIIHGTEAAAEAAVERFDRKVEEVNNDPAMQEPVILGRNDSIEQSKDPQHVEDRVNDLRDQYSDPQVLGNLQEAAGQERTAQQEAVNEAQIEARANLGDIGR